MGTRFLGLKLKLTQPLFGSEFFNAATRTLRLISAEQVLSGAIESVRQLSDHLLQFVRWCMLACLGKWRSGKILGRFEEK